MKKKITAIILAAAMTFSLAITASAATTADAIAILRQVASGDTTVTTADAIAILKSIAAGTAGETSQFPPLERLSEEADLKLRENYLAFKAEEGGMWADVAVEDLAIIMYFGTFNGMEVVVIHPYMWAVTADMQYIELAEHTIELGSGAYRIFVHKDGDFVDIKDAYELGYLTADDIKRIASERITANAGG